MAPLNADRVMMNGTALVLEIIMMMIYMTDRATVRNLEGILAISGHLKGAIVSDTSLWLRQQDMEDEGTAQFPGISASRIKSNCVEENVICIMNDTRRASSIPMGRGYLTTRSFATTRSVAGDSNATDVLCGQFSTIVPSQYSAASRSKLGYDKRLPPGHDQGRVHSLGTRSVQAGFIDI